MNSQFCLRVRKAKEGTLTRLVLKAKEEAPLPMTTTQGAYVLFCNGGFYYMSHFKSEIRKWISKAKLFCVGQEDRLLKLILQGFVPAKKSPLMSHSMSLYP